MKHIVIIIELVILTIIVNACSDHTECQRQLDGKDRIIDSLCKELEKRDNVEDDYVMVSTQVNELEDSLHVTKEKLVKLAKEGKANTKEYEDLLGVLRKGIDDLSEIDDDYAVYKNNPLYGLLFETITKDIKDYNIIGTQLVEVTEDRNKLREKLRFYEDLETPEAQQILAENQLLKQQLHDAHHTIDNLKEDNAYKDSTIAIGKSKIKDLEKQFGELKIVNLKKNITNSRRSNTIRIDFTIQWNLYQGDYVDLYFQIFYPYKIWHFIKDNEYHVGKDILEQLGSDKDPGFSYSVYKKCNKIMNEDSFHVEWTGTTELYDGPYRIQIYLGSKKIVDNTLN